MFSVFFFLSFLTGTMGKGAIIQTGKSPVGLAVQIPGNQKNKLNDPGGGSFRYILARRAAAERLLFPAVVTWGQHFTKKPPHDYRLHSQLRL